MFFVRDVCDSQNVSVGFQKQTTADLQHILKKVSSIMFIPYPMAFPYGNGMVLHFYQQQESSTTKTVHKVINKELKTYV